MRLRTESKWNIHASFNLGTWVLVQQIAILLLIAVSPLAQEAPAGQTFSMSGVVKSGTAPIPGATVTATSSSTGEKTATSTDINGIYALQVATQGKYGLRVEMPAFAASTQEVVLNSPHTRADLELALLSRTQRAAHTEQRPATARANRGFQSLAVMQDITGAEAGNGGAGDQIVPSGMPVPGIAADTATESVSISGNGSGVGTFGMSTDELDQRMRESREQQGGFGGGQGGPGAVYLGGPGGGPPGGAMPGGGRSGGGPGGGGGGGGAVRKVES